MEGKASDWRPGPTVCRCCLAEGCYKDISTEYFWMGKREVYSEMLSETLNVTISYSKSGGPNSNSRLICEPCISRLRDASEFKRQVIDCEKTFMHYLDPGSSSKSQDLSLETIGEVKVEVVKREKQSLSDDDFDDRPDFLNVDSDDDLDDQPLTKLASKIPKKESVDLLELLDSSQITIKRKSNLKVKTPPKKIVKKKIEVVAKPKPSASKAPAAKQTEKKKDEEWTTTDASDKVITHCTPSDDEWITTDCVNTSQVKIELDCLKNPRSTHTLNLEDEWNTIDLKNGINNGPKKINTEQATSVIKKNNVDEEWPVSNTKPNLKQNELPKKISSMKQCVPLNNEWTTTTFISQPSTSSDKRNCSLPQIDNNVTKHVGGNKKRSVRIDKKWVEIISNDEEPQNTVKTSKIDTKPVQDGENNLRLKKKKQTKVKTLRDKIYIKPRHVNHTNYARKCLPNARLMLKHTTAVPIRIQLRGIEVPCFACESKFIDPYELRIHFFAEHKDVDKTKGMHLYNTLQTRVDITDLSCLLCAQSFDNLEEAARHLFQEHEVNIDMKEKLGLVPIKLPQKGLFICAVCKKKCLSFRDLYRHSGTHFTFYVCEICGKKFEIGTSLNSHISQTHVEGHRCKQCKTIFTSSQELRQHVRDGCTNIKCTICKLTFGYNELLRMHKEKVHGAPKRLFNCLECSKVFEKRMQLYFHFKREHTDDHKCETCGKRFSDSHGLKSHMLAHTGERPHKCHICHHEFTKTWYFNNHVSKCKP